MNYGNPEREPLFSGERALWMHDPAKDPMMEKHFLRFGSILPENFRKDYKEQVSLAGEGILYRRTRREGAEPAEFDEIAISGNELTRRVTSVSTGEANTTIIDLDNESGINKAVLKRDTCIAGTNCPDELVCQVKYEKSVSPGCIPALVGKKQKGMRIEVKFPDFRIEQKEMHSAPPIMDKGYDYTLTYIWRNGKIIDTITDISEIGKRPRPAFVLVERSMGIPFRAEILSNSEAIISFAKAAFKQD